ncbi:hypothetical protein ACN4EG_21195 [Alkalinema pantanalense CENA528]|uniref:hypothetical protein n=1 Tax=Alkalinema pantanalense TaxID=1620705 RepID=UPI003D6F33BF
MTQKPHDTFVKQYLYGLLDPLGEEVEISREVPPITQRQVDLWFKPKPEPPISRDEFGLLGRMVSYPCLIEPFRNPAPIKEIKGCLNKLLTIQADLEREAKKQKQKFQDGDLPWLWICVPTASEKVLTSFGALLKPGWGDGVFFLPESLQTAIVVIHQLPTTPETLWLRLLGRDSVQRRAVEELLAMPQTWMQLHALEALAQLQILLRSRQNVNKSEEELIMQLSPVYQKWLETTQQEARQAAKQEEVERLLQQRYGAMTPDLAQVMPVLLEMGPLERAQMVLQLTQDELVAQLLKFD